MRNAEVIRFLQDYNSLLDEINDEIEGIDDMPKNKKATKLSDVNILDLQQSEFLYDWYIEIKNNNLKKTN
jgi:hypothetical protein